jgi:hypothetical protein
MRSVLDDVRACCVRDLRVWCACVVCAFVPPKKANKESARKRSSSNVQGHLKINYLRTKPTQKTLVKAHMPLEN